MTAFTFFMSLFAAFCYFIGGAILLIPDAVHNTSSNSWAHAIFYCVVFCSFGTIMVALVVEEVKSQ